MTAHRDEDSTTTELIPHRARAGDTTVLPSSAHTLPSTTTVVISGDETEALNPDQTRLRSPSAPSVVASARTLIVGSRTPDPVRSEPRRATDTPSLTGRLGRTQLLSMSPLVNGLTVLLLLLALLVALGAVLLGA